MPELVSAAEFDATADLPDWRYLLGAIEATFVADSFGTAAALVEQVGAAADAANHHPDVDLRYPGRVHVVLMTHAVDGLTTADVELARTISALAAAAGGEAPNVDEYSECVQKALGDDNAVRKCADLLTTP